jgi:O-6-methylguanine DNA methyltransferase
VHAEVVERRLIRAIVLSKTTMLEVSVMTRHVYDVATWGVGELWLRGTTVVHHELLFEGAADQSTVESLRAELETVTAASGRGHAASRIPSADPDMPLASRRRTPPRGEAASPLGTIAEISLRGCDAFAADLCRRFTRHLAGEPVTYADVELDLEWCTPFQQELARALRAVPWGEIVSYGELATLAGRPGAARAAGSFCAGNRFMLLLPCHRVVAADGIGGYGVSGVGLKRRLLRLEGTEL